MPINDGSVRGQRLVALRDVLLTAPGRRWRTSEIAAQLGVSVDTAARDLNELSRSGSVPLFSSGSTSDFMWEVASEERSSLPPLHLNYAQGAALYAAARLLSQQHDERNDAVRSALLELIRVLPEQLRLHIEATVLGLVPAEVSRRDLTAIFTTLSEGWLHGRVVRLRYEPLGSARVYTCQFRPYLLEPSGIGYTLYFIGHSDPPGALRTYKLERIQHAELTDEQFTVPEDFDGPALFRRAWHVMYGESEPVHIKLRFSQFVARRVRETRWHPSETLTETANGLIWEADIGDVTEIRPWIRGWGADCEVLEPTELRDDLVRETRRLMRMYDLHASSASTVGPDQSLLDDLFGKD